MTHEHTWKQYVLVPWACLLLLLLCHWRNLLKQPFKVPSKRRKGSLWDFNFLSLFWTLGPSTLLCTSPFPHSCLHLLPIHLQALLKETGVTSYTEPGGDFGRQHQRSPTAHLGKWLRFGVIGPLTPIPNCCEQERCMYVLPPVHVRPCQL